jgi:hypothetical protein
MYAIQSTGEGGPETVGWLLADEADMWAGPGSSAWTGKFRGEGQVCIPDHSLCGYTVQKELALRLPGDSRMRMSTYGKGITFWETDTDAAQFVNFYQDVLAANNYWYTDLNICAQSEGGRLLLKGARALTPSECHRAANYGTTIDRVRSLVSPQGSRPIWAAVELGHPASEQDWPTITPAQIDAAVWSSVIHGARGIIYFNHSFAGACPSQHILRDPCYKKIRRTVTRLNKRITSLAPVLNAPFADNVLAPTSVDAMVKLSGGQFYVFAASRTNAATSAVFRMPCVGRANVTVLGEHRLLAMNGGAFRDTFANAEAVHIYRIEGGGSCGLG